MKEKYEEECKLFNENEADDILEPCKYIGNHEKDN
jgi:hypothetical protein